MDATQSLAMELTDRVLNYPHARHFIIAHSHGGNIVCYALRDHPELAQNIAGVITLSTPFLHANILDTDLEAIVFGDEPKVPENEFFCSSGGSHEYNRSIEEFRKIMHPIVKQKDKLQTANLVRTFSFLLAFWPLLTLPKLLELFEGNISNDIWIPILLVPIFVWGTLGLYGDRTTRVNLKLLPPRQLLIIRVSGDEASISLIACQVGIWLGNLILKFAFLPIIFLFKLPILVQFFACIIFSIITFYIALWGDPISFGIGIISVLGYVLCTTYKEMYQELTKSSGSDWTAVRLILSRPIKGQLMIYSLAVSLFLLVRISLEATSEVARYTVFILSVLVSLPLFITPLFTGLSMGVRHAFSYLYLSFAIEPSPPGAHTIHQFGMRADLDGDMKTWLNHSIAYESREIVDAIKAWIKKTSLTR